MGGGEGVEQLGERTNPISATCGLWVAIMVSEKCIQYIYNVHTVERVAPNVPASFGQAGQGLQVVSHQLFQKASDYHTHLLVYRRPRGYTAARKTGKRKKMPKGDWCHAWAVSHNAGIRVMNTISVQWTYHGESGSQCPCKFRVSGVRPLSWEPLAIQKRFR